MGIVIAFPPSLVDPFLGTWIRDPLSVSRNKVVKRMLGVDALRLLWNCGSNAEVRRCLEEDPELKAKYDALCGLGREGRLVITRRFMTWTEGATGFAPGRTVSAPIGRISTEGNKIVVHSTPRPAVIGHALRKRKDWLLVTERYAGLNAVYFPPSPTFRYYRAGDVAESKRA